MGIRSICGGVRRCGVVDWTVGWRNADGCFRWDIGDRNQRGPSPTWWSGKQAGAFKAFADSLAFHPQSIATTGKQRDGLRLEFLPTFWLLTDWNNNISDANHKRRNFDFTSQLQRDGCLCRRYDRTGPRRG